MREVGAIIEGSHGISQSNEKAYTCYCAFCAQGMVPARYGCRDYANLRALRMDCRLTRISPIKCLEIILVQLFSKASGAIFGTV